MKFAPPITPCIVDHNIYAVHFFVDRIYDVYALTLIRDIECVWNGVDAEFPHFFRCHLSAGW